MSVEKYEKDLAVIEKKILKEIEAVNVSNQKCIDKLQAEFVNDNALAKIGDIVADRVTIIRVDSARFYSGLFGNGGPSIRYRGCVLTKKLVNRKDGIRGSVTQCGNFRIIK